MHPLCALASHVVDEQVYEHADVCEDGVVDMCRSDRDMVELRVRNEANARTSLQ